MLDGVCFLGILGFAFVSFIKGTIGPLFGGAGSWVSDTVSDATDLIPKTKKPSSKISPSKLKAILEDFKSRIVVLEQAHPELMPKPEPTMEELLAENAKLKKLAEGKK